MVTIMPDRSACRFSESMKMRLGIEYLECLPPARLGFIQPQVLAFPLVHGTVRLSRLLVELRDKNVKLERFYDCKSNSIALIYSPAFFRSRCSKADFIRSHSLGS
jgi:hypothetical protein